MKLLEKDAKTVADLVTRFIHSIDSVCIVVGVCNPDELHVKEALESQLKTYLRKANLVMSPILPSPDDPSQNNLISGEPNPGEICWFDLIATKSDDFLSLIEQKREEITKRASSIFILTDYKGLEELEQYAPNFYSLAYPVFFGIESFIERLRGELKGEFSNIINNANEFEETISTYLNRERNPETNYFLNLRQWNSYTPILHFREGNPRGGGYFLKWDDTGIVIDPGHGFIQNLFECGLGIADIDTIIITHDHPDHTQEFPLLIDLLFQFNKRKPEGAIKKQFSFLLNTSSFAKFAPIIRYETKPDLCQILWKHKEIHLGKTNAIHIKPTLTKHPELAGSEMGVGLLFNLLHAGTRCCAVGITSDTAWTPFLVDEFNDTDVLVAHLGTVNEDEIQKRKFYGKHLGILGLYNLLTQLLQQPHPPRIVLLSEFGEELCHSRSAIAKVFQSSLPNTEKTLFLPADIGIKIRLGKDDELHPLCSYLENGRVCGKPAPIQKESHLRIALFCEKHGTKPSAGKKQSM